MRLAILTMITGLTLSMCLNGKAAQSKNDEGDNNNMQDKKTETSRLTSAKPSGDLLKHVPDETFLKTFKEDPRSIMCRIPESVTYVYRHPITTLDDGFVLYADAYFKEKKPETLRPALIFMHDWAGGKQPVIAGERQCSYFALTENIFAISLYYRQPMDARFPAALEDLKCAIRWLRSIAGDYAIDPDKIIVMGSSAGTQWTWLAAATNGEKKYEGSGGFDSYSSDVNMAIINAGICDFVNDFGNRALGKDVIGGTMEEMPERFHEASPLHRLKAGMPPVLMLHGEKDTTCLLSSAEAAHRKLQELEVPSKLIVRMGVGHGVGGDGEGLANNLDAVREFINRHFY